MHFICNALQMGEGNGSSFFSYLGRIACFYLNRFSEG